MEYDFSKLRGIIRELYGKDEAFAKAMNISTRSLSLKLNGIRFFKPPEISKAIELLNLQPSDIPVYFFTLKV